MANFHYGDLHSCTYRVLYLLYLLTNFELVGRRYGLFLKLMNRQLSLSTKCIELESDTIRSPLFYFNIISIVTTNIS